MISMYYADCQSHGEAIKVKLCTDRRFRCNACYNECPPKEWPHSYVKPIQSADVRTIKIHSSFGEKSARPCNGTCTSGKRSCDCRCNGRCHGAGKCLGGHS